jgi:bifunctional non-homologous end joining protein LigD
VHEARLDGFRWLAQVKSSRLRLWSRTGGEWVDRLPELEAGLSSVGDVVLDGEVVVLTADGRADFELLGARIHGRRHNPDSHSVTFFVFDIPAVRRCGAGSGPRPRISATPCCWPSGGFG